MTVCLHARLRARLGVSGCRAGAETPGMRIRVLSLFAGVCVLLAGVWAAPAGATTGRSAGWYEKALDSVPRAQWNANDGYCGETSVITAGLRFGQYTSQWTAREMASPGVAQTDPSSQLLLGVNDLRAVSRMRLDAVRAPMTTDFLKFATWVRQRVARGDVVILGMLNNTTELGEDGPGDPEFDHIVPVYGYGSVTAVTPSSRALPSDVITVSDNGLRTSGAQTPMLYSYRVGAMRLSRAGANRPGGPAYSLPKRGPWYGVAVSGVADPTHVTVPVTVDVDVNGEGVQDEPVMVSAPASQPIVLTVTVDRPKGSAGLVLYEFDSFGRVPVRDFAGNASSAARVWRVPAGSGPWTVNVPAMSSDTRAFRAAPAGR